MLLMHPCNSSLIKSSNSYISLMLIFYVTSNIIFGMPDTSCRLWRFCPHMSARDIVSMIYFAGFAARHLAGYPSSYNSRVLCLTLIDFICINQINLLLNGFNDIDDIDEGSEICADQSSINKRKMYKKSVFKGVCSDIDCLDSWPNKKESDHD